MNDKKDNNKNDKKNKKPKKYKAPSHVIMFLLALFGDIALCLLTI